jgi:CubicO group peptidase (beta-lactamase class C family)
VDNDHTPGAAIAIVQDGEIVYKKGYGMANLEYDIPVTPATVFHIASVSKQFTAFAILLLEKDGLLSLDDDVRMYIPEVPDFGKTITLRHLAHHTSGLRDQWNLLALAGWRLDDVITREQILKLVSKQRELNFDPGEEMLYCNTGYTLLAEVVARVSGQSFPEFTEERIFRPLHMDHTLFYDDHELIVKNRAYSYSREREAYKKSVLSYANVGATSLFTTVEDLSLWALNFEDPVVGDADLILKLRTKGVLNNGDTLSYALGQSLFQYRGLDVIGHGGADAGYRTNITRVPEYRFAVMVFSNNGAFNPAGIANRVMNLYLADAIESKKVETGNSDGQGNTGEQADAEEQVDNEEQELSKETWEPVIDPDTLEAYQGEYEIQPGAVIEIVLETGGLVARVAGQEDVRLKPVSTFEFEVVGENVSASFHRNESDQVQELRIHEGDQTFSAARLEPFDADQVDLSEYVGQFYSDELSTSYEFINEQDTLVARHQRHSDITLTPLKRDGFSGNTWFFGALDFVRDASGSITGCKVSSGRVRNVYFRKTATLPL